MRRWFALGLCLFLLAGTAGAEVFAVAPRDGRALLVTADGEELTDPDDYSNLYMISDDDCPAERRLFVATPVFGDFPLGDDSGMSALVDARGNRLTDFLYDSFAHNSDQRIVQFYRGNLVGAMDEEGNVLLDAAYGGIVPDGEGGFLATPEDTFTYDPDGYAFMARLYHISADGTRTDTGIDTTPYLFGRLSEGLMPVTASTGEIWQTGYVNARGEMAIEAVYEGADAFRGGYAVVQASTGFSGMIDTAGNWAIDPTYLSISDTTIGARSIAAVRTDNTVDIIDRATLEIVASHAFPGADYVYAYESGGIILAGASDGAALGYGMDGTQLFALEPGESVNGSFYFADGTPGRMVLTVGEWPRYESYIVDMALNRVAGPYQELSGARWSGDTGSFLMMQYGLKSYGEGEDAYDYIDYESYRYGLVDQDGNELLPTVYLQLWPLSDGLYWAKDADISGIIDEGGNWIYRVSDYEQLID